MVFCISVDIQHLEMLIVVVHTIFKSFLSWMNLFETVLRTFEIVSKAFELDFACDSLKFVHLFIGRSLTFEPEMLLGFLPNDVQGHHLSERSEVTFVETWDGD